MPPTGIFFEDCLELDWFIYTRLRDVLSRDTALEVVAKADVPQKIVICRYIVKGATPMMLGILADEVIHYHERAQEAKPKRVVKREQSQGQRDLMKYKAIYIFYQKLAMHLDDVDPDTVYTCNSLSKVIGVHSSTTVRRLPELQLPEYPVRGSVLRDMRDAIEERRDEARDFVAHWTSRDHKAENSLLDSLDKKYRFVL